MSNVLHDALLAPMRGDGAPFLHLADRVVTRDAFLRDVARMAAALRARGLAPGDRLAMRVGKSAEALALVFACVRAGVVFMPLNPAYTAAEIDYFVGDAKAAMLVADPGAEALGAVAEAHGARFATLGDTLVGETGDDAVAPRGADDLAALLYTSGTTGRSKGAMLTHANLLSNARTLAEAWRFTDADVLLHALPLFHTHGLFVATNVSLAAGGSMILLPRFDVDAVLGALPRATAMMGVPTFYTRLLADSRLTRDAVAHVRLFVSGSAPMLADTHRQWTRRTGHRVLERYGMTETNMIASNPYEGERRPGSVGPPLPGVEVAIREEGRDLPPGETGEIAVRGPNVFAGYWRMPERTAEELSPDGWFRTGDLGTVDADGYVTIVGRAKDLVISGGFNVYPREVEAVLDALPGVGESAVVGVPHPDLGEAPVAVLAAEGDGPDLAAVERAVADRLARYKHPRAYVVVDALPRNAMGKVKKALLREVHAGAFSDGA